MQLILAAGLAFVVSAVLIRFVLLSPSVRERIVAAPVAHRWHDTPTPSFAGIPMFIAVVVAVFVGGGLGEPVANALVVGAGVLFVTGLVDDIADIRPLTKLAGQTTGAVAAVAIAAPPLGLTLFQSLVTVAWIILIANSVNLLDNMDGLAGGTSLVSLLVILPVVIVAGLDSLAIVVVAVAGATAGFLLFNVNPAKVFMGDTGSLWLGLVLASTVAFTGLAELRMTPLVAATILAVPLVDTASVIYARTRSGRSIMTGGRDHLSHRLVRLGLSEKKAVLVLNLAALACGAIGVSTVLLPTFVWVLAVIAVWVGLVAAAGRLLRIPVYQEAVQ